MDPSRGIVFCDASYFVFYRYYAVKGWYKKAMEKDLDVRGSLEDKEFLDKYDSTFEKLILDIAKRHRVPLTNVVFARDCSRESIWRYKLYPAYKGTRDERVDSFNGEIFKHTYEVLFPRLRKKYGFQEMMHPHLEADDIIAISVKVATAVPRAGGITIITNDNDYVQLYKHGVEIINLQKKSLRDRVDNVDTYIDYKVIVGDKSDNIPSIAKKVGDKTAKKMIEDPAMFEKVMGGEGVRDRYELNRTLIDFERIPVAYRKDVEACFRGLLLKGA